MLRYRLITGPLLVAVLLLVVWLDDRIEQVELAGVWQDLFRGKTHPPPGVLLFVVGMLIAPIAARELSTIFRAQGIATRAWLNTVATMLGLTMSYAIPYDWETSVVASIVPTGIILVFVLAIVTFSARRNVEGVVASAGAAVFALTYLGLMFGFFLALRRWHSAWFIVGVILTTKACDTGAYFTGRALGRHKMIAWLSPGKTWEGLAGGVALAMATGAALAFASQRLLGPSDHVPIALGAACGLVFAVVGQCGDLTVSLFKRGAGLKDTSRMLPGMGGVLDVLDSPLMVAPVAYWIFRLAM